MERTIRYEIDTENLTITVVDRIYNKILRIYEIYKQIDYDRFLVWQRDSDDNKLHNLVIM